MMDTQKVGGWTSFAPVTKEDEKIFNKATQGILGVKYTPEQVSHQLVAGTNYRFICKAVSSTNPPREYYASISFWVKLDGEIENFNIIDLSVNENVSEDNITNKPAGFITGGYVAHEYITEQDKAVFEYVTKDMYGVDYELKAVASQIVNGINYKFICISKIVVPYAQPELVMMEVYTKFAHSVAPIVKVNKITKL